MSTSEKFAAVVNEIVDHNINLDDLLNYVERERRERALVENALVREIIGQSPVFIDSIDSVSIQNIEPDMGEGSCDIVNINFKRTGSKSRMAFIGNAAIYLERGELARIRTKVKLPQK